MLGCLSVMRTSCIIIFAFFLVGCAGTHQSASLTTANPTGTWKWTSPTIPDGQIPNITFNLKLQGETLTGTVTKQNEGVEVITNGVVRGDGISFQVISQPTAGQTTITFNGKLNDDTINGKVEIDVGGKKIDHQVWDAKRVKE